MEYNKRLVSASDPKLPVLNPCLRSTTATETKLFGNNPSSFVTTVFPLSYLLLYEYREQVDSSTFTNYTSSSFYLFRKT